MRGAGRGRDRLAWLRGRSQGSPRHKIEFLLVSQKWSPLVLRTDQVLDDSAWM